jgi:hypothetical protein
MAGQAVRRSFGKDFLKLKGTVPDDLDLDCQIASER